VFLALGACKGDPPSASKGEGRCVPPPRSGAARVALEPALGDHRFDRPVEIARAPGGRFYVLEQRGIVKVVPQGSGEVTTALDLTSTIGATGTGEGGLLGIAVDPGFASNGAVYLHFTAPLPQPVDGIAFHSVVARVESADGGLTLDASTLARVLVVDQPYGNHNGGKIAFGPDGMLYVALGDGGSGGDPQKHGQNVETLLGAILRIDPHAGDPYGIPDGNPFAGGGGRPEIYAYGLRNPWKMSFDTETGDLWAGDVGQSKYEEIDRIVLGGNYGWNVREGKHCFGAPDCPTEGFIDPVTEYGRDEGISVTGGYVYRGSLLSSLFGKFIYGDFGSGTIWAVDGAGANERLAETELKISTFGQDDGGEVFAADYATGRVQKLVAAPDDDDDGAEAGEPLALLSETGCVDMAAPGTAAAGLVPYTVNSPLWSDGADKERFLYVPEGGAIGVRDDGDFDVPNGTVAVKTFLISGRRIETRLFVRYDDGGWAGFSYEWNDAQTDAVLLRGRKTKALGSGQTWYFPSRADCFACHTPVAGHTLGLEARQQNRDEGGQNQLTRLAGLFDRDIEPASFPALAAADTEGASAEDRARGYLHANCSMCHREGSGAGAATMDLRIDRAFGDTRTCNVAPQAGDLGVADPRLIAPGDPSRSTLTLRMRTLGEERMPGLATSVVDEAGASAVEAWIAGLAGCP
jgi:uncharacterized repeat protein (TIGR03806 family)